MAASSSAGSIVCHGGSTTVTVSGSGGTAPYTGTGNFTVTGGTYTYVVKDAKGCSTSTTITVNDPIALTTTATGASVWPTGSGSASVTASGGTPPYAYLWSTGATTSSISGLGAGTYSVTVIDAHGCTAVASYGVTQCLGAGGGHTLGFWSNKNGQALITDSHITALNALNLRNESGSNFDLNSALSPNKTNLRNWLLSANATNMAYMLSAQLAAMKLNVLTNGVDGASLIYSPGTGIGNPLGFASVNDVMSAANALLESNPMILDGNRIRPRAEALKTALDKANNNLNFLVRCSSIGVRDISPAVTVTTNSPLSDESITVSAYPNPSIDKLNIEFRDVEKTHVNLQMFTVTGERVQTLFDGMAETDLSYKVEFTPPVAGLYIYRLVTAGGVIAGKVIHK